MNGPHKIRLLEDEISREPQYGSSEKAILQMEEMLCVLQEMPIPKTRHRDHDLAHWILGIVIVTKMKTVVD
jgi:hypothetical protein